MANVVKKGIEQAAEDLEKENKEKLLQEVCVDDDYDYVWMMIMMIMVVMILIMIGGDGDGYGDDSGGVIMKVVIAKTYIKNYRSLQKTPEVKHLKIKIFKLIF